MSSASRVSLSNWPMGITLREEPPASCAAEGVADALVLPAIVPVDPVLAPMALAGPDGRGPGDDDDDDEEEGGGNGGNIDPDDDEGYGDEDDDDDDEEPLRCAPSRR